MSLLEVQTHLKALGFDPGRLDGAWGPRTEAAVLAALARCDGPAGASRGGGRAVPLDWMPDATMTRVILHWTAGTDTASPGDREHYHLLINGDGGLVRGVPTIDLNSGTLKPGYAAHTRNCNTGSIGVSLAGMAGAQESPFDAGKYPLTAAQWGKPFLTATATAAIPVLVAGFLQRTRIQVDAAQREAFQTSLTNAAGLLIQKAGASASTATIDVRSPAMAEAIRYVQSGAPDAIRKWGITPESVAEKIVAKVGLITAAAPPAPTAAAFKALDAATRLVE